MNVREKNGWLMLVWHLFTFENKVLLLCMSVQLVITNAPQIQSRGLLFKRDINNCLNENLSMKCDHKTMRQPYKKACWAWQYHSRTEQWREPMLGLKQGTLVVAPSGGKAHLVGSLGGPCWAVARWWCFISLLARDNRQKKKEWIREYPCFTQTLKIKDNCSVLSLTKVRNNGKVISSQWA